MIFETLPTSNTRIQQCVCDQFFKYLVSPVSPKSFMWLPCFRPQVKICFNHRKPKDILFRDSKSVIFCLMNSKRETEIAAKGLRSQGFQTMVSNGANHCNKPREEKNGEVASWRKNQGFESCDPFLEEPTDIYQWSCAQEMNYIGKRQSCNS